MSYRVEVDDSPTYELLVSLRSYTDKTSQKLMEMGIAWVRQVRQLLPPEFDATAADLVSAGGFPLAMVPQAPDPGDSRAFLEWLAALPPAELYDRVLACVPSPEKVPPNLVILRDRLVRLLAIWDECYFSTLDPALHRGLAADAEVKRRELPALPPAEAVERATSGIWVDANEIPGLKRVVLIPQYHGRPFNMFDWTPDTCLIAYPVDPLPPVPGAVPGDLRALIRALSDDSRLLILRYLRGGIRSFTDVLKFSGLAKSTVHHHLVTLRASGLVRVHVRPDGAERYSLRPEAVAAIGDRVSAFLKGE